ncbi:unnamed protein product [Hydatigera taeniaeformis]|uniref:RUN domain-containing protein n=1 Tax=Hydatigena taeniaeformis TaxID=6205 RepID=A0A158REX5_HYDTA|nr:unnamed protein product [Hydatigera taeniaeformis]
MLESIFFLSYNCAPLYLELAYNFLEHDDIVEISYNGSKESSYSSEEVVIDVPLIFDKSHVKVDSKVESPAPMVPFPLECVDVVEPLCSRSVEIRNSSNKSSLSSEELAVDKPQISGRCNLDSHSGTEEPSRPEDDVQMVSLKTISKIEPEVHHAEPLTTVNGENTTVDGIANGDDGEPANSNSTRRSDSPVANLFLRIVDLIEKINEITGRIGKLGQCLIVSLVLKYSWRSLAFVDSSIALSSAIDEVRHLKITHQNSLPYVCSSRQVGIILLKGSTLFLFSLDPNHNYLSELEMVKSSLKELEKLYSECGRSLSECQEKHAKCGASLKETRKQLKNRDELYESCRNKLLELQEKIIDRQQGLFQLLFLLHSF